MRPVRYNVAASLDGLIAGPHGEYDWIPHEPLIDFEALFARVDTILLGRKSYEAAQASPESAVLLEGDARIYVFSRTLDPAAHPKATVVQDDAAAVVQGLRDEDGDGEIWLFGGGGLFASLLAAGQVDRVEVTVAPALLGGGIPLLPPGVPRTMLELEWSKAWPSGMVSLHYRATNAVTTR